MPFADNFDLPVSRPQVILVPAPMYHTNGFATLNSLLGGDRLIILEKFDAELMLDAIERFGVTTFTATPDDAATGRRRPWRRIARPVHHRVDPARRRHDAGGAATADGSICWLRRRSSWRTA